MVTDFPVWEGGHEVEFVGGLAAAGDAGWDVGGGLAIEFGVHGVGQAEFQAAQDLVLEGRADFYLTFAYEVDGCGFQSRWVAARNPVTRAG